jgi:hypothetical protein
MEIDPEGEIRRLLDIMPASGRMGAKITSQPAQPQVIVYRMSRWGGQAQPIEINFGLWGQLPLPQRDLLLLAAVSWLKVSTWWKVDLYQGAGVAGLISFLVELAEGDVIGLVAAAGLSAIAATQAWRTTRGLRVILDADQTAIQVAKRRGYSEPEAAQHLLKGLQAVNHLEGHPRLSFNDLIRTQNLRAIAGLTPIGVPSEFMERRGN